MNIQYVKTVQQIVYLEYSNLFKHWEIKRDYRRISNLNKQRNIVR